MIKKWGSVFGCFMLFILTHFSTNAQDSIPFKQPHIIQLQIEPTLNNQPILLGQQVFIDALNDSAQIDRLRFYISDIHFTSNSGIYEYIAQRFFLMDAENKKTLTRKLPLTLVNTWDSIHFNVGVDSTIQMLGAQGGELDPTKGMYWSWRSGYINFKCEGVSKSCPGRKNEFLFHIGGFQAPYNSIQKIDLAITASDTVVIQVDLTSIFTPQRITSNYKIMSPNAAAMTFANQIPSFFRIQP